jgi:pimeloyl-ACP methyl ester carboxylesterase
MATTQRGDLTISHLDEGKGPVALLLHSGGAGSRQWLRLAAKLKPFRRVIAPDLLGYGTSTPYPKDAPFHHRNDLRLVEALLEGVPAPFDVVGHSYGGFLALQLARSHPEMIRSLAVYEPVAFGVLFEPPDPDGAADLAAIDHDGLFLADATGGSEAWLERFVDYWNGQGAWKELSEPARASFRAAGRKVFQEVASVMADRTPVSAYAVIQAPTLLVSGGESPKAAQRVVERLAGALPRARRVTFPDTGHMGPLTNATAVNDLLMKHMEEAGE